MLIGFWEKEPIKYTKRSLSKVCSLKSKCLDFCIDFKKIFSTSSVKNIIWRQLI